MKGLAMLLHSWLKNAYPHLDWSDPATTLKSALPAGFDLQALVTQVQLMPALFDEYTKRQARIETMLQTLTEAYHGNNAKHRSGSDTARAYSGGSNGTGIRALTSADCACGSGCGDRYCGSGSDSGGSNGAD